MERTTDLPVYDTAHLRPAFVQEFVNVFRYRHLLFQLVRRNITIRYRRSFLGVAWSMLNPLGMMIVMAVVFSKVFGGEIEYRVFLLSGLLAWNFFAEASTLIIGSMIWGSELMQQVYVPRSSFALSSVGTGLLNLLLAIVPLLGVMLWVGVPIQWTILIAPIPAALILLFTLGVGLFLSVGAMYFADINEMFKVVLRAWMYLTPIVYPESLLIDNGYSWLLTFNPMYYLVRLFRVPFQFGRLPTAVEFLPALAISLSTFLIGWLVFNRYADEFTFRV